MPFEVKLEREEELLTFRRFRVVREEYAIGAGRRSVREIVRHRGAAVLVPVQDDGRLMLLRQYRYTFRSQILEFPAGTREPGEEWFACAQRELAEEVGMAAAEWQDLGILYPAPGFCDEEQHCYLARGLTPAPQERDEDELIELELLSVAQVEAAIRSGELRDAKSIAALMRARLLGLL